MLGSAVVRKSTATPDVGHSTRLVASPTTTRASSSVDSRRTFLCRWRLAHSPSPFAPNATPYIPKVVSLKLTRNFNLVGSSPGYGQFKRQARTKEWGKLTTRDLVSITMKRRELLTAKATHHSQGRTPRFVHKAVCADPVSSLPA